MNDSLVRRQRNQVIRDLLAELDLHGPGEGPHAYRVAVYAVTTGQRLGLDDAELLNLRYAAELHDVGKIKIDRELLGKLGELSDADFDVLRSHARRAEELLLEHEWLKPAIVLIRHHHERFDGEGYPAGLAGEMIPMGARIIAVAEAYDTIAAGSAYRCGLDEDKAIEEVRKGAGTQFDPRVVQAFLEIAPLIQPISL
ncbi:MAG: HD domain-containing protein [Chthonomonas sp.]|nr:HD domain-containing protein [Chthonomonas sp.]